MAAAAYGGGRAATQKRLICAGLVVDQRSGCRVVKISHDSARGLDRYIGVRTRHAQACRPLLWLGVSNRGPMTASSI
jgi:hypothetical protein